MVPILNGIGTDVACVGVYMRPYLVLLPKLTCESIAVEP